MTAISLHHSAVPTKDRRRGGGFRTPQPPMMSDVGDGHVEFATSRGDRVYMDKSDAHLITAAVCVSCSNGKPYPTIRLKKVTYRLHRLIMGAAPGMVVDHINGDTFDNRRSNLRFATVAQNAANSKLPKNNTSGFRGVYWFKPAKLWSAQIRANGKNQHLGYFKTVEAGARAYDEAAKRLHGNFARLNFPESLSTPDVPLPASGFAADCSASGTPKGMR